MPLSEASVRHNDPSTNKAASMNDDPDGYSFAPSDDDDHHHHRHHHHQQQQQQKWTQSIGSVDGFDDLSRPLSRKVVFAYGVGHMLNDVTAASWFTYLLIFLTGIGLSPSESAFVMLSGQLADGLATIFVGNLIDNYGHYKLWHAGGSLLVAISFSSVFGGCWVCAIFGTSSRLATTIAYSVFAAIFNVGWAATQVAHMALVNCISTNATVRVGLTSCRNAFTMVANLCLYAIAYFVFRAFPSKGPDDVEKQYRLIARASVLLGWSFILVFYAGVKEPRLEHLLGSADSSRVSCLSWFHKILYYQVAFVYMITRLTTNVSQAFLAFYLIDDLDMRDSAKAVVPAAIYICSFVVSIAMQEMGSWTGQKIKCFFVLGASLWILSGGLIFLLSSNSQNLVYLLAGMVGIANALMTVTAVSMEGILVGLDVSGCAFVYASLSFLDKFVCGIALFAIEALNTDGRCRPEALGRTPCHRSAVRMTLTLVPGGCALLGVCVTLLMDLHTSLDARELQKPLLSPKDLNEPGYALEDNNSPMYSWTNKFPQLKTNDKLSVWKKITARTFWGRGDGRRDKSGMLH